MDGEQRDAIRESNRRRRRTCPKCGSTAVHELSTVEMMRRDDVLPGLRYKTCGGCGNTWTIKGKPGAW